VQQGKRKKKETLFYNRSFAFRSWVCYFSHPALACIKNFGKFSFYTSSFALLASTLREIRADYAVRFSYTPKLIT
jgi:hypothetical protein